MMNHLKKSSYVLVFSLFMSSVVFAITRVTSQPLPLHDEFNQIITALHFDGKYKDKDLKDVERLNLRKRAFEIIKTPGFNVNGDTSYDLPPLLYAMIFHDEELIIALLKCPGVCSPAVRCDIYTQLSPRSACIFLNWIVPKQNSSLHWLAHTSCSFELLDLLSKVQGFDIAVNTAFYDGCASLRLTPLMSLVLAAVSVIQHPDDYEQSEFKALRCMRAIHFLLDLPVLDIAVDILKEDLVPGYFCARKSHGEAVEVANSFKKKLKNCDGKSIPTQITVFDLKSIDAIDQLLQARKKFDELYKNKEYQKALELAQQYKFVRLAEHAQKALLQNDGTFVWFW